MNNITFATNTAFTMKTGICHEQHWHLPWTTLTFATNTEFIMKTGISHEQHW